MSINVNGCTTCIYPGQEVYEPFKMKVGKKAYKGYQYDYRHYNGMLFSCTAPTLEECRERKNEWVENLEKTR